MFAVTLLASGCIALNDYSQFSVRDGGAERDAGARRDAGPPPGCTTDEDCADPNPTCDLATHTCVPCSAGDVSVVRLTPAVHFILPNSAAMNNPFGATTQTVWSAVLAVFRAAATTLERLQSSVRFGMTMFTAQTGACPTVNQIPPALGNAAAIQSLVQASAPVADMPLGDVLTALNGATTGVDPAGVVYLHIVPNVPDTCAVPNPNMGQPEALAATAMAFSSFAIRSDAIGLSDLALTFPNDLAAVGGGGNVWTARDGASLTAAFEQAVRAAPCRVSLTDGQVSGCDATVTLAGVSLVCDDPNGWRAIDPTTIEILGISCAQMHEDATLVPTVTTLCSN